MIHGNDCNCEPYSASRCEYRLLADCVIEQLNPPDGEDAEVSICMDAVERIVTYVTGQPCACAGDPARYGVCPRCRALGQNAGKPVQR